MSKTVGRLRKLLILNSDYYYQHLEAFRRLNPYEDEMEDWENDVGFPGI